MRRPPRGAIVILYFLVFWVLLPAALLLSATALDRGFGWGRAAWRGGLPVLALGLLVVAFGMTELWTRGRGLPVSALPPPRLARSGPYRFVRHPIYLGFNIAVFGAGMALGSPALTWILAPAFLPFWIVYARVEERGLVRRFGARYRRYQEQVGLFPRPSLAGLARWAASQGLLGVRYSGREHVPRRGPAVVVGNHCCFLDPIYLSGLTPRSIHFLVTADVYRGGFRRWLARGFPNVPLRRYRPDPGAYRELLRLLADGEVVGLSPEGERSFLGEYQGARPEVARILARLPAPVVPVGLNGSYDCGPRWSGVLRRRPVLVRAGPPVRWGSGEPAAALDRAIRSLLDADPQPVHLRGLPARRLGRVLWRCPRCRDEARWHPAGLACASCGARFEPTADGRFADQAGQVQSLGVLGRAVAAGPEVTPLKARAEAWFEASGRGPIRPLEPKGLGILEAGAEGLRFGSLWLPLERIRSVTTERDDTLQVADRDEMWQFRLLEGSVFRFHGALERWRGYPASLRHAALIEGAASGASRKPTLSAS